MCSSVFYSIINHDVCIMIMKLCIVRKNISHYKPMRSSNSSPPLFLCALHIDEYRKQILKGNIVYDEVAAARAAYAAMYSIYSSEESRRPLLQYKELIDQSIRNTLDKRLIDRIRDF